MPFSRNGSLVVSFEEGGIPALLALKQRGEANGVKGLSILGREALLAREPNLNPAAQAALDVPSGGIVCPYELTIAYAEMVSWVWLLVMYLFRLAAKKDDAL